MGRSTRASGNERTPSRHQRVCRLPCRLRGRLRRKGRPIPTNDLWIAAGAFEHGVPLLTRDDHFRHVDGLLVASGADDLLP
ncbi:MAG: PIN domain-containing protein [Thermoleophilia bacterium]